MENHVFQKAKTKEEYLGFVARLIIHVREMIDEDTDSDSSSSNSDSEIETYVDEDSMDDSDEDESDTPQNFENGTVIGVTPNTQQKQDTPAVTESYISSPHGVKRKCIEEGNASSSAVNRQPVKWNSQMNEWEAVGVNVFKKLQRMEPHQALYAESLITKVLRLGLLQSLTPETDVCRRPQIGQSFASLGSSQSSNFVTISAAPMYVNTHQSVGNSTFSNTVPQSTSLPVITTNTPAFVTEHGSAVEQHNSSPSYISLSNAAVVSEDHNSPQGYLSLSNQNVVGEDPSATPSYLTLPNATAVEDPDSTQGYLSLATTNRLNENHNSPQNNLSSENSNSVQNHLNSVVKAVINAEASLDGNMAQKIRRSFKKE